MKNKAIFDIAYGKDLTWKQVADEYNRGHADQITPNGARKAYKRHLSTIESSVGKIEERKRMNTVRSVVEQTAREYTEKSVVAETIANIWGKEPYHETEIQVFVQPKANEIHGYAFGDVHWGYTNNHPKMTYSAAIAEKRLWEIANKIIADTIRNDYKRIFIADLGDQIEGSALRVSQLLRIVETMTQQAKGYSDTFISILKWISKQLPDVEIQVLMVSDDNHGQLRLFNTKRDEMPDNLSVLITNAVKNTVDTAHEFGGMSNIEFITADEILVTVGNNFNIVFAHGHQYGRNEDILQKTAQRHDCTTHLMIAGHWHRYSIKYKNVIDGGQQAMVFLPSVVGDTDFSDQLFLSCYPGFAKITVDLENRVTNAELIRLKQ